MAEINSILNSNGMSMVTLIARHHQDYASFKKLLSHIKAENIIVIPTPDNEDSSILQDMITETVKTDVNVIFNTPPGVPLSLDGRPLRYRYISRPAA